jgi:hypothetical protein
MQMSEELYSTWDTEEERSKAYADSKDLINAYDGIQKSFAYRDRTYLDIQPGRSVRPSFTKYDYGAFVPQNKFQLDKNASLRCAWKLMIKLV